MYQYNFGHLKDVANACATPSSVTQISNYIHWCNFYCFTKKTNKLRLQIQEHEFPLQGGWAHRSSDIREQRSRTSAPLHGSGKIWSKCFLLEIFWAHWIGRKPWGRPATCNNLGRIGVDVAVARDVCAMLLSLLPPWPGSVWDEKWMEGRLNNFSVTRCKIQFIFDNSDLWWVVIN